MEEQQQEMDRFEQKHAAEDAVYTPPSSSKIPQELRDHFKQMGQGYVLQWVRYSLEGGTDVKNLKYKQHPSEGCEFVRPDYIPEELRNQLVAQTEHLEFAGTDVITQGDLVLMMQPIPKLKAKKAYYSQRREQQAEAARRQAGQNKLKNSSYSETYRGKSAAHFRD